MFCESNYAHNKIYNMTSRITLEVDFENNNEPVIQVMYRHSDDVRDKLLSNFLQILNGESTTCVIKCVDYVADGSMWVIRALPPEKNHEKSDK